MWLQLEKFVESGFQQTLGDKCIFQHDNNLKHKGKYTLELLTKTTLNFPEWPWSLADSDV